ncbi:MAG: hypothetical protein OXE57_10895, partial [Alphaproteobacteria bacterium]|nr:hypothetical protein [Alphaproteobacteria bacterium]
MKLGVVFPQTEIGADPGACRDFAQAAEDLGFAHLLAFDHVLGADPAAHELTGPYTHDSMFHQPGGGVLGGCSPPAGGGGGGGGSRLVRLPRVAAAPGRS